MRNRQILFSRHPEGGHRLVCQQFFDHPLDRVFDFFSDARQLERITPPWVNFRILTPLPIEMRQGTLIDYRLKLHGIGLKWRTEICLWNPPYSFADQQLRGPYRKWLHVHRFEAVNGGTLVIDDIHYRVPLDWLMHRTMVRPDLKRIFTFRQEELDRVFPARTDQA